MPYRTIAELPDAVKDTLPKEAQRQFLAVVNSQLERGLPESRAFASAWSAIKQSWEKGKDGEWHRIEKIQEAVWTPSYISSLPDSAFAYIEPGGEKDEDGKTVPRSLRHLPYKDAQEGIDLPHLRNALARLSQTALSDTAKAQARKKLETAVKQAKIGDYREAEHGAVNPVPSGVMVCLRPDAEIAATLAVPGGLKPEELHVTLAFLGGLNEFSPDQINRLQQAVLGFSFLAFPLHGHVSGVGRFYASEHSDNMDVIYASVDLPALPEWREHLIEILEQADLPVRHDHGFSPHVTLGSIAPGSLWPSLAVASMPLTFTHIYVAVGEEWKSYPLIGYDGSMLEALAPGQTVAVPQVDGAWMICGVVLTPGITDEDLFTAEVIAKAAHAYAERMKAGEMHVGQNGNLMVAESYLAPVDFILEGHPVPEGSWVVGIMCKDPAVAGKVASGEYAGLSVGGKAWVA